MTKLEALNKLITEKLDGTKEGKTILEAVNLATKAYGGAGDASGLGEAIEQLYTVFTKGGGGGEGDEHVTLNFSKVLNFSDEEAEMMEFFPLSGYAVGKVSYTGLDLSKSSIFPALINSPYVTAVDYTGVKGSGNCKYFDGMLCNTAVSDVDLTPIDFSNAKSFMRAFAMCPNLKSVDLSKVSITEAGNQTMMYTFAYDTKLETVDISNIDLGSEDVSGITMFIGCTALTHVKFKEGVDWFTNLYSPINLAYSPLDRESIIQLFNNLGTPNEHRASTIALHSTTLGYLSDDDKAIATNKGWTLA